ncbi:hypothetical protein TrCOL_g2974 [Triparma columacea]|uniref:SAM domain-containing protein n=1 Tax=Triparma columacea TaxID=722753 RepID=A0A9W7G634_9STRA|nr:hypothetical protein TrCOL_g2974 [Triparma columacea]
MPNHLPFSQALRSSQKILSLMSAFDQSTNLSSFLAQLGLSDVEKALSAEGIDLESLKECNQDDLKELGLNMGQRKTILREIGKLSQPAVIAEPVSAQPVSEKVLERQSSGGAPSTYFSTPAPPVSSPAPVPAADKYAGVPDNVPTKIRLLPAKNVPAFMGAVLGNVKVMLTIDPRGSGKELMQKVAEQCENRILNEIKEECCTPSDMSIDGLWLAIKDVTAVKATAFYTTDGFHINNDDILADLFKGEIVQHAVIWVNVEVKIDYEWAEWSISGDAEKDKVGFLGNVLDTTDGWGTRKFTFTGCVKDNRTPTLSWQSSTGGVKTYVVSNAFNISGGNMCKFIFSGKGNGEDKRDHIHLQGGKAITLAGHFAIHERAIAYVTEQEKLAEEIRKQSNGTYSKLQL